MTLPKAFPQSHTPSQLHWTEKLVLATKLVLLLCYSAGTLIRRTLRSGDYSYRNLLRNRSASLGGNAITMLSLRESRAIFPPTGVTIDRFCTSNSLRHEAVQLDETDGFSPATLHFIDCSPEDRGNVFLYFHGGGYIFSIGSSAPLVLARKVAASASATLAVLEYTVAPEVKHPGQLAQAAASLRFLLQKRHNDPSRIIIGGDSAGGNLTLAVLAHMQSPHPRVTPIEFASKSQRLRAALCISPRANNVCTAPSYKSNASKDYLSAEAVHVFTSNWQPVFDEVWATPVSGSKAFWVNVRVSSVLLVVGEDEIYLDDVKIQAELMGAGTTAGANLQLKVCPGEVHDQPIMDLGQGIEDGRMTTVIMEWLRALPSS